MWIYSVSQIWIQNTTDPVGEKKTALFWAITHRVAQQSAFLIYFAAEAWKHAAYNVVCLSCVYLTDFLQRIDDDDDNNNNNKHWYEHVPKSAETSQGGKVTILWNQQVQTDKTAPNNKPGIIIHDNEKETCMLIDVAISGDRNVIKKEAEKIL